MKLLLLLLFPLFATSQRVINITAKPDTAAINARAREMAMVKAWSDTLKKLQSRFVADSIAKAATLYSNYTTAQMLAIPNPEMGKTIMNITTQTKWYWNGVLWKEQAVNP